MNARDEVLRRIRSALSERAEPGTVARCYRRAGALTASVDLFCERVEDYRASVHRTSPVDIPELLARLLPGSVVVPDGFPDDLLVGIGHVTRDHPRLDVRALDALNSVLTACAVAIAETGTVVLDAGAGQGRRALTLVPDHHVVVVRANQVVANVPEALERLDAARPLTWISGPSATSDIELERIEGVHGPRRLDVVVVEG